MNTLPTDAEWEDVKAIVQDLYINRNLKLEGPDGLIATVARDHGFHATKAQYERRLRKWNFRKNQRAPHDLWSKIAYVIREREQQGKQSQVLLNGKPVSDKKLSKELSRYCSAKGDLNPPTSPLSPLIRIKTPGPIAAVEDPAGQHLLDDLSSMRSLGSASGISLELDNLPSIQFDFLFSTNFQLQSSHDIGADSFDPTYLQAWSPQANTTLSLWDSQLGASVQREEYLKAFFNQLKLSLFLITNNIRVSESDELSNNGGETFTALVNQFNTPQGSAVLKAILSWPGLAVKVFAEKLFQFAIKTSNVAIVLQLLSLDPALSSCKMHKDFSTFQIYCPLSFACDTSNFELARVLLQSGADPNQAAECSCDNGRDHCTPLFFAIPVQRMRDFRFRFGCAENASLIHVLKSPPHSTEPFTVTYNLDLIQLLLEWGADVNISKDSCWSPLKEAVFMAEPTLVQYLLAAGADPKWTRNEFPTNTTLRTLFLPRPWTTQDSLHSIFNQLVQSGATVSNVGSIPLINLAAFWGNVHVYEYLRTSGATIDSETMDMACRSKSQEFVMFILETEDPQLLLRLRSGSEIQLAVDFCSPALSVALLDYGFRCKTTRQLRDAIRAAAHGGGVNLTLRIIASHEFCHSRRDVTLPEIDDKIVSNGAEITSILLSAGALVHASALAKAIDLADLETFKILQASCPNPNLRETSLVKIAILCRDIRFLRHLLSIDHIDIHLATNEFESGFPFQWALFENHDMERKLRLHRTTPLEAAIALEETTLAEMLIEAGADLDGYNYSMRMRDEDFRRDAYYRQISRRDEYYCQISNSSPLYWAVNTRNMVMVHRLLNSGAKPDDADALAESVNQRDLDIARLLLFTCNENRKVGNVKFGFSALNRAIANNLVDFIDLFLTFGVEPIQSLRFWPIEREIPLGIAIRVHTKKRITTIRKLLLAGFDPNSTVEIHEFGSFGGGLRYLYGQAFDVDGIYDEYSEYFEKGDDKHMPLLTRNAPLSHSEYRLHEKSALVSAIEHAHLDVVQLLIEFGSTINAPATARQHLTPLQAACKSGNLPIFNHLLHHGADIHAAPAPLEGGTALQLAAIGGHIYIASVLLERGADVDAAGSPIRGRSALEGAAEWGRLDMVQLLLNAGASVRGPRGERQYRRALGFARKGNHRGVVALLEAAAREERAAAGGQEEVAWMGTMVGGPSLDGVGRFTDLA